MGLLDMFEGFKPIGGSPCGRGEHLKGIVIGLFIPAASVYKAMFKADETSKITAIFYSVLCQCLWFSWLGLQVGEVDKKDVLRRMALHDRRAPHHRLLPWPAPPQVQRVGLASRRSVRHHVHVPLGVRPDDDAG